MLRFTFCLNEAIFLVSSISTVQESRMCIAVVDRRVEHGLVLHVGNFNYVNS